MPKIRKPSVRKLFRLFAALACALPSSLIAPLGSLQAAPSVVPKASQPAKTLTPNSAGLTDEEQLLLEMINRARANPAAEAQRIIDSTDPVVLLDLDATGIDPLLFGTELSAMPPAPPLAPNQSLTEAARTHSQDMLANAYEGHDSSDGTPVQTRFISAGYAGDALGENVFSYAQGIADAQAAFEVDWGQDGVGGIADPPQHRLNDHDPLFREIGLGVIHGMNAPVGPTLVTEDFGYRADFGPFITGVVYYDLDGDHFYSLGEGIGGAVVTVSGSGASTITSDSGGYAIAVPGDGQYDVTLTVPGLPAFVSTVVVTNGQNVKVDATPVYPTPRLSGPAIAPVNQGVSFTFSPVPGASAYDWKQTRALPISGIVEGAENGVSNVTASISSGYSLVDTNAAEGSYSFRLLHPQPAAQVLALNGVFRLGSTPQLRFVSRLGMATTGEVARAQISTNRGRTWVDVWTQTGTSGSGDTSFQTQTVSLAPFAGEDVQLRFRYDVMRKSYFSSTDAGYGFYLDAITFSDAEQLEERISQVPGGSRASSFWYVPQDTNAWSLSVRGKNSQHAFDWGTEFQVQASAGPAKLLPQIVAIQPLPGGQLQIAFIADPAVSSSSLLQTAPSPSGPWTTDTSALVEFSGSPNLFYAISSPATLGEGFYRISTP